ncbi:MAG: hypothetical protein ABIJ21_06995 [Nanoarchaeota archaeon]
MRILFVCTGNVFRSVSAELLCRGYLEKQGMAGIQVSSAGTSAMPQPFLPVVLHTLSKYGIHVHGHKQTRLTEDHFKSFDVVVAMAESHVRFIKEHFSRDVPLFNEIVYGTKTSVQDVNEAIPDWMLHPIKCYEHVEKTIAHLHDAMPVFMENVGKFMK